MSSATRGQRRHLVTLENPGAPVSNGDGGYTQTWTALSPETMYASILTATARDLERVTAGTVTATATHIVTMDFHPQVTLQTRISWTSPNGTEHTASVVGVANSEERDVEMVLTCVEAVN